MDSIINFKQINPLLACAGQPTENEIAALADEGYHTIVNLGLLNTKYALTDEATFVKQSGMDYYHLPVAFDEPKFDNLATFIRLMTEIDKKKVLVHCAVNYRASTFVGLYLLATGKLDDAATRLFIEDVWQPDATWEQFIDESIVFITHQK
jgi:protein tyrosine phosphatase (PTP) superfamily phosphohydrolase (DUF442 family)